MAAERIYVRIRGDLDGTRRCRAQSRVLASSRLLSPPLASPRVPSPQSSCPVTSSSPTPFPSWPTNLLANNEAVHERNVGAPTAVLPLCSRFRVGDADLQVAVTAAITSHRLHVIVASSVECCSQPVSASLSQSRTSLLPGNVRVWPSAASMIGFAAEAAESP
jgi:hypothetical protein